MKVVLYEHIDGPIYGNQRHCIMLAETFAGGEDGRESEAWRFRVVLATRRGVYEALKRIGHPVKVSPNSGVVGRVWWLMRTLRSERPDAVLCNNQKSFLFVVLAAWLNRVPIVYYIKGLNPVFLADLLILLLSRRILTISPELVESVHVLLVRGYREKTQHLPIGIYLDQFSRIPGREPMTDGIRVLMFSSIVPRKGVDIALDAMALLEAERCPVNLQIVGGIRVKHETYFEQVSARVARMESVVMREWTNDIPALLNNADIVILPTYSEGTPRSLVEAMAAGRPVIATRVGGIPSLIKHGETGMLIDPGDPQQLAAAIVELIKSPEKRVAMGISARRYALANHAFDRHMSLLKGYLKAAAA